AAKKGYESKVGELLRAAATDKDAWDKSGRTALHHAAENGHESILQMLLDQGVNKDISDNLGQTALHLAGGKGHMVIVRKLLDSGENMVSE
ncbi:ankyrin, partial [Wilcoxina mikolae CBS 423.85]